LKRNIGVGLFLAVPTLALAQGNMNMQGVSGLLNVPDASVIEYGTATIAWDNQVDGRFAKPRTLNATGNDINFAAGAFPHFEMVGRNVTGETTSGGSDLSFNLKLQLPWELLPGLNFAIGEMDFGGSVNEYDTKYAVATWQYGPVRTTLGVGKYDGERASTGRLDGVYGGVEFAATDWLSVILEDDAYSMNTGIRLSTPAQWLPGGWQASMLWMVSTEEGVDDRQDWYGFNVKIPLAAEYARVLPKDRSRPPAEARVASVVMESYAGDPELLDNPLLIPPSSSPSEAMSRLGTVNAEQALRDRFVAAGFEQVRVQKYGRQWIVAFENLQYNANDIDALGVAAGVVATSLPNGDRFYLQLEQYGIATFGLGGEVAAWKTFLSGNGVIPDSEMVTAPSNKLRRRSADGGIFASSLKNSIDYLAFRPDVRIRPMLSSTLGTEFGVFDYSLAARADVVLPLWRGAAFNISRDWNVYDTKDFTRDGIYGGVFYNQRTTEGVKERIFSQTFRHGQGFTSMVSYGRFYGGIDGASIESRWEPGDGRHRFKILATDFEEKHRPENTHNARLWSYRYFAQSINSEVSITGGVFYNQDSGYRVEFAQHVGDVRLHLLYKTSEDNSFATIGFTVPLTPRKGMGRVAGVHVEGQDNWAYGITTILGEQGNRLVFGPNVVPTVYNDLRNTYYNGDRLNGAYIRANQERLVDAWQRYGSNK
jgi:hypothetical protein